LDITSHMCKARFELFTAMDIQIMVFWVGCDVMWWSGRIPSFRRTFLPPSSRWSEVLKKEAALSSRMLAP